MRQGKRGGIPTDRDGFVPREAMVRRFHERGNISEADHAQSLILPSRLTPEEIREWWEDPSVCDIEGIDTPDSDAYAVPVSIRGRKRKALERIAVLADRKEVFRIKKILADSFTAEELELMASGRSLMISERERLRDCTGYYLRRQDGVPVPEIVLEKGTTPDGIVHEAVHDLRAKDGRTVFPTRDGILDPDYRSMPKYRRSEIVGREERETVAETVARTSVDPMESGYYERVPGLSPRQAYLHDQKVISGSKALRGKAAIRAARENYDRSQISRAIITANRRRNR